MVISVVYQSDSVIYAYIYILFHYFSLWFATGYWIQFPVLYTVGPYCSNLQFVNEVYHTDCFVDTEKSLHPCNKSHLIIVYNPFNASLDLICKYFFACVYVHHWHWLVFFLSVCGIPLVLGFPGGSVVKNPAANIGDSVRSLGQDQPWKRKWQLTSVFLLGKFHGQRSLAGYNPWGHKESDMA